MGSTYTMGDCDFAVVEATVAIRVGSTDPSPVPILNNDLLKESYECLAVH